DIEILPKDSIVIFVEVTIDPNNLNTPYIVTDSVFFTTNGNVQKVDLVAWGQNAYFHYNSTGQPMNIYGFSCNSCFPVDCNTSWPTDKPHIIFGYAVIDTACSLTIPSGAKIYFYNNSGMLAYKAATLVVDGSIANPVNFEGFRRELHYRDVPGQWDRIWLGPGSKDNVIRNAIIKNGNVGLQIDTVGSNNPTLLLENTIISNMASVGILGQGAVIEANNSVISKCGDRLLALVYGGNYTFKHCSFGNYWSHSIRQAPSLLLNNFYIDVNNQVQARNFDAFFGNCIIWGTEPEELEFAFSQLATSNYIFDHCIIRTGNTVNMPAVIKSDPLFSDVTTLEIGENSPAINSANPAIAIDVPTDINGNSRLSSPDRGAYERQ
ncbi:MAG: choice-of-anchor Q domain-containing protein, partial [Bacteroidia bacterium]